MTEQWGAPLTGAQMGKLQLRGGEKYLYLGPFTHTWGDLDRGFDDGWEDFEEGSYRLPADHIAYTLLEAGWLDGRNVRLWFGGDEAPSDWGGENVLLRYGGQGYGNRWTHEDKGGDIIAYIRKDDVVDMRTARMEAQRQDQANILASEAETVTIAKMTEAEAERLYPHLDLNTLKDLRLIKEPTREERFWAMHEAESTTVPAHIKKWVKDALEFER